MTPSPDVHEAGAPVGLVQRCARCGIVLLDRTGEMMLDSDAAACGFWFAVGAAIEKQHGFVGLAYAIAGCPIWAPSDAFHVHLDECRQCRNNPFGLCAYGKGLLVEAVDAADRP